MEFEKYHSDFFDAVRNNNLEKFKDLINSGYDIATRNQLGQTALHLAMIHCDRKFISYLIDNAVKAGKLNINVRDTLNNTPLHYVVIIREVNNIKMIAGLQLISEPLTADIGLRKYTIKNLLSNGADINVQDRFGRTPLIDAAHYHEDDILIKYLLELGADKGICDFHGFNYLTTPNPNK